VSNDGRASKPGRAVFRSRKVCGHSHRPSSLTLKADILEYGTATDAGRRRPFLKPYFRCEDLTLYEEQWRKLLDMSDQIRAFMTANETQLKAKD
jgi:hypothetical protein